MGAEPLILGGIQLASTVGGAVSKAGQADAAANASNYNAQIALRNSELSIQQGKEDEAMFRMSARKKLSSIQAGYSAAGVTGGSSEDVLLESTANAEHDALMIRYGAQLKSLGYQDSAYLDRKKAASATAGGYMSAAGTILNGGSKIYKDWAGGGGGEDDNYYGDA